MSFGVLGMFVRYLCISYHASASVTVPPPGVAREASPLFNRTTSLLVGRRNIPVRVRTSATLMPPSGPQCVFSTMPIGQTFLGKVPSTTRTTSPVWSGRALFMGSPRGTNSGRYSFSQRFQNWSASAWLARHARRSASSHGPVVGRPVEDYNKK